MKIIKTYTMMGGGGGSMQSMQSSLNNNRNLLKGRKKGFFKRELTLDEVRKKYKKSIEQITRKKTDKKHLKAIRDKIIQERRVKTFFQVVLALVVLAMVTFVGVSFLMDKSFTQKQGLANSISKMDKKILTYENNMLWGEQNFKAGQYFMAIGNYKKALVINPNSFYAEYALAKTYTAVCKSRNYLCNEGADFILMMEQKYPDKKGFTLLKNESLEQAITADVQVLIHKEAIEE